jgi:transposase
MESLYPRCCGLDVHKRTVVACAVTPGPDGQPAKQTRTFGTMTADLLVLSDWLAQHGVTHVAVESTGVYWKPVHHVLEGRFTVWLVNAQHVKQAPGRKTDAKDCEWLADLLRHGLLRPSFVPDRAQRALRDLTRTRTTLVDERAAVVNRLQKVLEDCNIKLGDVATNVLGVSGRAMLEAPVAGETDPALLADLARGQLRRKRTQLEQALSGRLNAHHRFLIAGHLAHVDFLDEQIERLNEEVAARLRPVEAELERLETIPGVGRRTAQIIAAEVGLDMGRFPSSRHLASWAGVCPGNHVSAGKRGSGKARRGDPWLRRTLLETAHAAKRTKDTELATQYKRLVVRRGQPKALLAVGHSILVIVYYLLRDKTTYQELSPALAAERQRQRAEQRAVRQLRTLGYEVTLTPRAAVA